MGGVRKNVVSCTRVVLSSRGHLAVVSEWKAPQFAARSGVMEGSVSDGGTFVLELQRDAATKQV